MATLEVLLGLSSRTSASRPPSSFQQLRGLSVGRCPWETARLRHQPGTPACPSCGCPPSRHPSADPQGCVLAVGSPVSGCLYLGHKDSCAQGGGAPGRNHTGELFLGEKRCTAKGQRPGSAARPAAGGTNNLAFLLKWQLSAFCLDYSDH